MYFTSGSDRAFEQLMQTRPGADHFDNGEAGAPEDCGTCRFYRPHWKYQFCVYEECPYQPGKLTALDGAVKFQVKGVDDEMAVFRVEKNRGYTVMSNHHLRNKDLSLKAKGLLSQMLSLPESWDFTLKGLIRLPLILSYGNLVGVATPSPPFCGLRRLKKSTHERRFIAMKKYNTPHRHRVIKTRLTEEEFAEFSERVSLCKMSQSEYIRQALIKSRIRPVITVSPVNDELLSAVGKLTAEYGKIGGNLNQIARCLNEYGAPYNALSGEVRAAIAELAALKFEVLQAKHRLEEAQARDRVKERKARTRRLIQEGAVLEKVLPEVQTVGLDNLEEYLRRKLAGHD